MRGLQHAIMELVVSRREPAFQIADHARRLCLPARSGIRTLLRRTRRDNGAGQEPLF